MAKKRILRLQKHRFEPAKAILLENKSYPFTTQYIYAFIFSTLFFHDSNAIFPLDEKC